MADLIADYRRLSIAEETLGHLDEALALVRRIASGQAPSKHSGWRKLVEMKGSNGRTSPAPLSRADSVLWALGALPDLIDQNAERIPDKQYSLLMDTLLLVFHQAYFVLLPKAKRQRNELIKAFGRFAQAMHRRADRFRLEGLIALESGDIDEALSAFRNSVYSTHAEDHEFLTGVQLLWTELLEHGRQMEAFEFLVDISSRVTRRDQEEFNEMLLQAFREALPQSRRGLAGTSA